MNSKNVQRLFSYRKIDDDGYELSNLRNGIAFFGDIKNFNDPSEGMIRLQRLVHSSSPFSEKSLIDGARILFSDINSNWMLPAWLIHAIRSALNKNSLWEVFVDLNKVVKDTERYRNELRVLCTTPISMHSLMWAHYADSHKGICIEYEVDYSNLPTGISSIPVNYTNEFKHYLVSDFLLNPSDFLARLLFTKHSDWSYESEWRFVLYNGNTTLDLSPSFKIISVTSGLKCEKDKALKELCTEKEIKLYKVIEHGIDGLVRYPIEEVITNA